MSGSREEAIALGSRGALNRRTLSCTVSSSLCASRRSQHENDTGDDDDNVNDVERNRVDYEGSASNAVTTAMAASAATTATKVDDDKNCSNKSNSMMRTLEDQCKLVIVKHIEKYPPYMFGMLSEVEWNGLIKLRHEKTKPKSNCDHRIMPAISSKYMTEVETTNEHLSESTVSDKLVWKDCVDYRFKTTTMVGGGIYRPKCLNEPYPLVKDKLEDTKELLIESILNTNDSLVETDPLDVNAHHKLKFKGRRIKSHLQALLNDDIPITIKLLKDTSIGKVVNKCIKKLQQPPAGTSSLDETERKIIQKQLKSLLQNWKELAQRSGVEMSSPTKAKTVTTTTDKEAPTKQQQQQQYHDDLKLLEQCMTWRDLYKVLEQRESKLKAEQGERMRQRKNKLNAQRPKIVKVTRKANPKRDHIIDNRKSLQKPASSSSGWGSTSNQLSTSKKNMLKLRHETSVAMSRSGRNQLNNSSKLQPTTGAAMSSSRGCTGGFGAAVAFANLKKKSTPTSHLLGNHDRKRKQTIEKSTTTVVLGSTGKRMKLPTSHQQGGRVSSTHKAVNRNRQFTSAIVKNIRKYK